MLKGGIIIFENLPDVTTVGELAEYLKTSEQTISRALKSGELEGFKLGRGWRISKEAVSLWLDPDLQYLKPKKERG